MYSNLMVGVSVKCSLHLSSKFVGKLGGKKVLRSDFLKGLKEVRGFLVVTRLYLKRYLLGRLPSLVHFE